MAYSTAKNIPQENEFAVSMPEYVVRQQGFCSLFSQSLLIASIYAVRSYLAIHQPKPGDYVIVMFPDIFKTEHL
jgi:hypothetical protein